MPSPHHDEPAAAKSCSAIAAVIDDLRHPPMASQFSAPAMALVLAIRLMASCSAAKRDPLVELSQRLESLTAAKLVLDFAKACSQAWPENAMVSRPCCHALTPDEAVFAQMADAAANGDREGFSRLLDGLIRRERHERLYAIAQETAAILSNRF